MSSTKNYVDRFLNPATRDTLCQEIDERISAMRHNPDKSHPDHVSDVLELAAINQALLEASTRVALQRHMH